MTVRSAASINTSSRDDKKKESDDGIKADVFKTPSKPKARQEISVLASMKSEEVKSFQSGLVVASTCGSSRWRMIKNIREFELKKPTNQIEAPCSELVKCNTDRNEPKPSQKNPKGVRHCYRSAGDSWWKSPCTETVSEDGDGLKKAIREPLLDLLQRMLENWEWDTHEIDCWARKQGYLWEGLVDKTKEAVVKPMREDLVSGV